MKYNAIQRMESINESKEESKCQELELELTTLENETASILEKFGSKRKSSRLLSSRGSLRHGGASSMSNNRPRSRVSARQCKCQCQWQDRGTTCICKHSKRSQQRWLATNANAHQDQDYDSIEFHKAATRIQTVFRHRHRCGRRRYRIPKHPHQHQHRDRNSTANGTDINLAESHSLREAGIHGSQTRLFRDDGTATSHLRTSISNAFKTNRFDSIAAMLAHESYGSGSGSGSETSLIYGDCQSAGVSNESRVGEQRYVFDPGYSYCAGNTRTKSTRTPSNDMQRDDRMVAPITMVAGKKSKNDSSSSSSSMNALVPQKKKAPLPRKHDDIAIREMSYPGFEKVATSHDSAKDKVSPKTICFNCWSARQGNKCKLNHQASDSSETTTRSDDDKPFCDSWDIGSVRQLYRSEDIEADQSLRLSSLRFAKDQRRRSAIAEHQSHPLFVSLSTLVANVNYRARRNLHAQQWFRSLVNCVKQDLIEGYHSYSSLSKEMRRKDTLKYSIMVDKITNDVRDRLPKPPITGYDCGETDILYQKKLPNSNGEFVVVDIIKPTPIPVPIKLYEPRTYIPPLPTKIEMGRLIGKFESACDAPIDVITYGSFGKKPAPNNLSVGGLSSEIVLSQKVETSYPPPYSDFHVIDSMVYSPKCTPESHVPSYISEIDAPTLEYVERPLEHALNSRGMPTIGIRTATCPEEHQQHLMDGDSRRTHGFRTLEYMKPPEMNSHLDTRTFVPADSIVTLNTPQVLPATPARVGLDYPFCETKSRDTKIEDLAHILEFKRQCTPNKPQVFTVMTKQQPGHFMRDCDPTRSLGRLETTVTRSWSFVQKRRIAMFYTDDGVPYYYDRRNGRTFWERPLMYDEESLSIAEGCILIGSRSNAFVGDNDGFGSSIEARSNMRKMILSQHESEADEIERDRSARSSRPNEIPYQHVSDTNEKRRLQSFSHYPRLVPPNRNQPGDEALNVNHGKNEVGDEDEEILKNVKARRVGKQYVHYIDSSPNLPQGKPVGRVKPRSAGKDWLTIGFDPWSAGKDLLTIEFIPKLTCTLSQLQNIEESSQDILLTPSDMKNSSSAALSHHHDEREANNLELFAKLSRCIRHGNFPEFDALLNEASWKVPIDYTDDVGNTLLMLCCQNGNKRMVKVCLRKGCDMDKHNCNGHTCLHYAFGYGFGTFSLICSALQPIFTSYATLTKIALSPISALD